MRALRASSLFGFCVIFWSFFSDSPVRADTVSVLTGRLEAENQAPQGIEVEDLLPLPTAQAEAVSLAPITAAGADLDAFLARCAPYVHPSTMKAIIDVESRGNILAININGTQKPSFQAPRTLEDAAALAQTFIDSGYSIDMGLMQINSANLPKLKMTTSNIFDPCTNLAAGAEILGRNYDNAVATLGKGQEALLAALSVYNTGDQQKGFENGYVGKFFGGGWTPKNNVPEIITDKRANVTLKQSRPASSSNATTAVKSPQSGLINPYHADLEVDLGLGTGLEVIQVAPESTATSTNPYTADLVDLAVGFFPEDKKSEEPEQKGQNDGNSPEGDKNHERRKKN